jgi:hypothetical protein
MNTWIGADADAGKKHRRTQHAFEEGKRQMV